MEAVTRPSHLRHIRMRGRPTPSVMMQLTGKATTLPGSRQRSTPR
jgi:hypothetical protein